MPTANAKSANGKIRSRKRTLILLAAIGAFIGFVFYSLERIEPVKVVDGRIERQGDRVFIRGVLRNTGPDLQALALEVSYYDGQGHKLAADKVEVGLLRHGTDVPFKTPARELAGVSDFSIYLDRGRNPYGN